MSKKYDFSGWVTRNDIRCSDGRTIRHNAFRENDGKYVPLVWNHQHNNPDNVLGRIMLENRNEGVYGYGEFNETELAHTAKELVTHGDVTSMSIYANQLKQNGGDVIHGNIREVSLVLAGANPGALIDSVMVHGESSEEEAIIYNDSEEISLYHADETKKEEAKEVAEEKNTDKTVGEVFDTLTEEQKTVVYALIGQAIEDAKSGSDDEEGEDNVKHNVFDNDERHEENVLTHSEMETIIKDAKRIGSLKESFLQHADEYGINDIEWLFPEAHNLNETPGFIKRTPDGWVNTVMSGVHHTPFSRIKMMFADIREDEARAKGYMKGKLKKEEVFGLLKRTVEPTTIYKKQKLDRDDVIDIKDFDIISWLKGEMRMMLDEEIARAILFGDGRSTLSEDKIPEANIIPACKDADLYTIKYPVSGTPGTDEFAKNFIKAAIKSQNNYQGSGNTKMFLANTYVTDMLLLEDAMGHRMYKDVSDLALAMSVGSIVKVPASVIPDGLCGLIVDLNDYNVGADKGGAINMFDDFDIDYNQMKYLIETRCSGALVKPYSAIALTNEGAMT